MAHDVPLLMNAHISGGWKYLDAKCTEIPCRKDGVQAQKAGEFFNGMADFREQLQKIVKNADVPLYYEPRKHLLETYGDQNSGKKLLAFVLENFGHRIALPRATTLLLPGSFV